jgi:hypothetical protein
MHGTGDLYVPIHLEQTLNLAVTAARQERLLVQRVYRSAGHCGFSVPEEARAFDDLVAWVRDGVKPPGDNVMGDLGAGRQFTDPARSNDPGTLSVPAPPTARRQLAAMMRRRPAHGIRTGSIIPAFFVKVSVCPRRWSRFERE